MQVKIELWVSLSLPVIVRVPALFQLCQPQLVCFLLASGYSKYWLKTRWHHTTVYCTYTKVGYTNSLHNSFTPLCTHRWTKSEHAHVHARGLVCACSNLLGVCTYGYVHVSSRPNNWKTSGSNALISLLIMHCILYTYILSNAWSRSFLLAWAFIALYASVISRWGLASDSSTEPSKCLQREKKNRREILVASKQFTLTNQLYYVFTITESIVCKQNGAG